MGGIYCRRKHNIYFFYKSETFINLYTKNGMFISLPEEFGTIIIVIFYKADHYNIDWLF